MFAKSKSSTISAPHCRSGCPPR